MSGLTDLLKTVAPTLATALGGPLAGAAVAFLASKLGVDPELVERTVAGMGPTDLIRMKELDYDFQKFMVTEGQKLNLAQIEVNKAEAGSDSLFKGGWRPAAGWVCVLALALTYIPKAAVLTWFWCFQNYLLLTDPTYAAPSLLAFPDLGVTDLIGLLMALLGMAGLRSVETLRGVASK